MSSLFSLEFVPKNRVVIHSFCHMYAFVRGAGAAPVLSTHCCICMRVPHAQKSTMAACIQANGREATAIPSVISSTSTICIANLVVMASHVSGSHSSRPPAPRLQLPHFSMSVDSSICASEAQRPVRKGFREWSTWRIFWHAMQWLLIAVVWTLPFDRQALVRWTASTPPLLPRATSAGLLANRTGTDCVE